MKKTKQVAVKDKEYKTLPVCFVAEKNRVATC